MTPNGLGCSQWEANESMADKLSIAIPLIAHPVTNGYVYGNGRSEERFQRGYHDSSKSYSSTYGLPMVRICEVYRPWSRQTSCLCHFSATHETPRYLDVYAGTRNSRAALPADPLSCHQMYANHAAICKPESNACCRASCCFFNSCSLRN